MRRAFKVLAILTIIGAVVLVAIWVWIRTDLARIESDLEAANQTPVAQRAVDAIVAVEDPGFTSRPRFDIVVVLVHDKASLTHDLVRQHLTRRGLRDIARGFLVNALVDLRGDHKEIAQAYAQTAFFGSVDRRPIYGMNAAASEYFARSADKLSAAQIAQLVATIRSPARFSPGVRSDQATAWRLEVLLRMRKAGVITSTEYEAAAGELVKSQNVRSTARTGLASAPRMRSGGAISSYSPSST